MDVQVLNAKVQLRYWNFYVQVVKKVASGLPNDMGNSYNILKMTLKEHSHCNLIFDKKILRIRLKVLKHWVLFICLKLCSNLCLTIEVFLNSKVLALHWKSRVVVRQIRKSQVILKKFDLWHMRLIWDIKKVWYHFWT